MVSLVVVILLFRCPQRALALAYLPRPARPAQRAISLAPGFSSRSAFFTLQHTSTARSSLPLQQPLPGI
jgi:hypothetical protein